MEMGYFTWCVTKIVGSGFVLCVCRRLGDSFGTVDIAGGYSFCMYLQGTMVSGPVSHYGRKLTPCSGRKLAALCGDLRVASAATIRYEAAHVGYVLYVTWQFMGTTRYVVAHISYMPNLPTVIAHQLHYKFIDIRNVNFCI